jgi:hypothetical protein
MQAVRDMVQNKRHRLIIGMDDLRNHNLDLARRCPVAAFPRSLLYRAFLLLRWASSCLPD